MATKNYIKMCINAREIQKLWIPGLGDICINKVDNKEVMVIASRGKIADKKYKFVYLGIGSREQRDYWLKKDKLILLPTQEQLQEMVDWGQVSRDDILRCLSEKANNLFRTDDPKSWNEFWMMIVMDEKYNKIWTEEDWRIKEGKRWLT